MTRRSCQELCCCWHCYGHEFLYDSRNPQDGDHPSYVKASGQKGCFSLNTIMATKCEGLCFEIPFHVAKRMLNSDFSPAIDCLRSALFVLLL